MKGRQDNEPTSHRAPDWRRLMSDGQVVGKVDEAFWSGAGEGGRPEIQRANSWSTQELIRGLELNAIKDLTLLGLARRPH